MQKPETGDFYIWPNGKMVKMHKDFLYSFYYEEKQEKILTLS